MKKNYFIFIFFVFYLVVLDQITKFFVQKILAPNIQYYYTNDFGFSIVKNKNIILTEIPINHFMSLQNFYILYLLYLLFVFLIVYFFYKYKIIGKNTKESIFIEAGFCFLTSACIGNGLDKWTYGGVIDFIFFKINTTKILVFNFADIFLIIAEILIIVGFIFFIKKIHVKHSIA
jgi:lipoprotein signal peptidase